MVPSMEMLFWDWRNCYVFEMFISMTCSFQLAFSADAMTCYRHADLCQEQGMLHKHPKGWFRLYGALQPRAFAHGGELLYEVDLSAGGSLM